MSSNLTAATATAITTLPTTIVQNVSDATSPNFDVWFKITAAEHDVTYGVWAQTPKSSTYEPVLTVWTGSPDSLTQIGTGAANRPAVLPTLTAGSTYYFRVRQSQIGVTPASDLRFQIQRAPGSAVPAGSIVIIDASPGWPAAAISVTTGAILQYFDLPAGESAIFLPDCTLAIENSDLDTVEIYDESLELIQSLAIDMNGIGQINSNGLNRFYIANGGSGTPTIYRVSAVGVIETSWVVGGSGMRGMAPSPDETIAYYAQTSGTDTTIKRWDLVNNIALSDLAADIPTATLLRNIIALADGTILASYRPSSGADYVLRYSAAGAVLNTYTFADQATRGIDRVARDPSNNANFWAWEQTATHHHFSKIRASDGTILLTFSTPKSIDGVSENFTDEDAAMFSASESCPMLFIQCPLSAVPTPNSPPTPPTVDPPEDCPCPPPDGGPNPPSSGPGGGPAPPSGTGDIGGGGFGSSGTNEGGTGFTPGAICVGGGTTLSYPEAHPGESMIGNREPRLWLDIAFQSLNAENEGTATPEVWSCGPSMPDTQYGGYKQQRVLGLSKITRALSNDNGDWKGPSVTARINDKDRQALRERLGDESTQFVWERLGIGYIASESNRRTGYSTPPRELFRGLTRDVSLAAGFTGEITFEDRLTSQIGAFSPDRSFSSRLLTEGLGCLVRELVGKPQQWIFGEVSDEGATNSAGQPASKGLVPIWLMAERGGQDEYHLAAHEICGMTLYGSDGGVDGQPPKRILLTDYHFETVDRTDPETGQTHRMTQVYLPSDSIASQDHKSGRLTMAANVAGVMGANGLMISDLFRIYQYIFEHIVLPEQESLTGEYVGSPQWPDGRYMIHSPSWLLAEALGIARMGGYIGGFVLGGPAGGAWTMRDLLKRFSNSSGYWFGWTAGGQLGIKTLDDAALVDDSDVITEPAGMRALPTPSFDVTRIENPILFSYDWDDDKQKPRVAQESVRDDRAIARTGGREKPSRTPIAMRCVRDPATARDVAQRELLRRKYPAGYYPVVEPLDGLDRNPGDIIRITSIEGPGASGVEEFPLFIRESSFDPNTYQVTHDCRDVSAILAGAARFGPDDLPAYSLATTAQRRRYTFFTDENGLNSNGTVIGKGFR